MTFAPKTKNIPSLFYINLSNYMFVLFKFIDSLSTVLNNGTLAIIAGMLLFPQAFFLIIGINLTMKNTISSISLYFIVGWGFLLIYTGFQPGIADIIIVNGEPIMSLGGWFLIIMHLFTCIILIYFFYWGVKTLLNYHFLIKRESFLFLVGNLFASVITLIIFFLGVFFYPYLLYFSYILITIGSIIIMTSILKEPKLLYILPFELNRLVVKDKKGYPLYTHNWSKSNINDVIFIGFLNRVQIMSEKIIDKGELLDIELNQGILIFNEGQYITVGLLTSKSSKLLRKLVSNFTNEFEEKFQRFLKISCTDTDKYKSAYCLIEKHFSNFPNRFIKDKEQSLLLISKDNISIGIKNQLENIFHNESDYTSIKNEIINSPTTISSMYFKLYNEMKEEIEKEDKNLIELDDNNQKRYD